MTPTLLMIYGAISLVTGYLLVILNFASKSLFSSGMVLRHLLFGGLASLGGLALVGGFIWFLVMKFVP